LRVRHPLAPAAAAVAAVVAFAAYLHWPATSSSVPSVTPFDETNANGPVTLFGRGADRKVVRVVDGDTVDAAGPNGTDRLRYRLIGFDTPETYYARCDAERALGERATRRLQDLVRGAAVRLAPEGDRRDRYGRGLARLYIDGRDVGPMLIAEGLAVYYSGHDRRIDWCAKLRG
jgi:micrococcal nuclease